MRTFFILLKADLLRMFGINKALKSKGKDGSKKLLGLAALAVFLCALGIVMSAVYTGIFYMFLPDGEKYKSVGIVYAVYSLIVLIMTVTNSASVVFGCKDYDVLMSLPVKTSVVALAKIAYVYVFNLAIFAVIILPSLVVYAFLSGSVLSVLITGIASILLAPLPSLVIGLAVGSLVAALSSRVKKKGVFGALFSAVFLGLYFWFIFSVGNEEGEIFNRLTILCEVFPPAEWFALSLKGEYLWLAVLDLCSVLVFALFVFIVGKNYKKINDAFHSSSRSKKIDLNKTNEKNVFSSLFRREFRLWSSSSGIIMNTSIGCFMIIILSVVFSFNSSKLIKSFAENISVEQVEMLVYEYIDGFLPLIPVFFIGLCYYSACSISLEGNRLWILKSLPLKVKDVFKAKIAMNLVFTVPSVIVCLVCFGVAASSSWADILFAMLVSLAYALFGALFGLSVNLKFPFFDWNNPTEAVKRGTSSMIVSLVAIFAVIPMAVLQFYSMTFSKYLGWSILAAVFILLDVIIALYLKKRGQRIFAKL